MNYPKVYLSCLALFMSCCVAAQTPKLKRSEGYLGFHFDFHASLTDTIGTTFTEALIDSMLRKTRPDYIQVDAKGHPGVASYPTKVGTPAAYFNKDIMKIWRAVTNKYNIPLIVHFSGVIDEEAVKRHPEWAAHDTTGTPHPKNTSTTGRYVDQSLIPQLKELIDQYQIDGAWVDGDCWALRPDYSPSMKAAFEATGRVVPYSPKNAGYADYIEFNREKFKAYVSHYVDALHRHKPAFEVTSNWIYSSMVPEKVSVDVDFLSGDLAAFNSVYSAAFESRCLALQGKPWDLMAWSFSISYREGKQGIQSGKSLVQLQQEAAEVIAMGGGYQSYWTQNRDGSIRPYTFERMAQINSFVRERQPFSYKNKIIPQIGIIYSTQGWKKQTKVIYGGSGTESVSGILSAVLDGQYSAEILMDHHLDDRINLYPLLIVPEWAHLDDVLKEKLTAYTQQGGRLIVIGGKAVGNFKDILQVDFVGAPEDKKLNLGFGNEMSGLSGMFQQVRPQATSKTMGSLSGHKDFRFPSYAFATINDHGKGKIAGVYMDMAFAYSRTQSVVHKNALRQIIREMFPAPVVEVKGSDHLHVVATTKENKMFIHLINTGGSHSNENVFTYNEVLPLTNISVQIKVDKKPGSITLQPGNRKLKYRYDNGKASVMLDKLAIHDILQVE